ncbi:hypothetical protein JOB18_007615 [Solea senegalensis]|uniref:Purine nucleoside phosphorylase LACC1 n=1 Tax=Solea senegalensis TaxID=28829 RepID=A0AAV6PJN2_SOLSE|nr:purine nucleoside phosphorylase LACC1 isoform X2 [Solea senegalensis]KAG7468973.1 hypothetical protein JOB18_007615 [Solea senegalensis]
MPRAVLIHGCGPSCTAGSSLLPEVAPDSQVFVLSGKLHRDLASRGGAHVHVLDGGSTAERVFRFKQRVDLLDLNTVTVLTSPRGRGLMTRYQQLLFTAVYTFEYKVDDVTCPGCTDPAHSPGEGVEEEVRKFLQQLPALRGGVTVLTSTLIPDTFGHGFSTREGGVSYIPNLSSLNLFSSSRRRDPVAVVTENRRRLAVRGGFHPKPLHLVKVNHASDVWVMSKAQPDSYDAIVTDQSGVVVAAPGADCMTLLFTDPVKKVGGVAHAGWKGTLMGVAMATVKAMATEFGCQMSDILVAVGPSVGACCFTLDRQEALQFVSIHPDCVVDPDSDRPHVNIRLANRLLLQRGGILPEHIHDDTVTTRPRVTLCTSCHPRLFFSHVRDGAHFGTQVGFLWIRENEDRPEDRGQT